MTRVWVTIPARNEQDDLHTCLGHVVAAARDALVSGRVGSVTVALAAHRCSDRTQAVADRVLADHPEVSRHVVADETSETVGQVRHRLVLSVLAASRVVEPADTWLFTTDADSFVPPDWITGTLAAVAATGAAAAAGDVELRGWVAPADARRRYSQIVGAARSPGGTIPVYGANLVARLDAYLAVGGFAAVEHGEDHDLVTRLCSAGFTVARPLEPVVSTSGRFPGRAAHGLGSLLGRLVHHDPGSQPEAPPEPALA